MIRRDFLKSSLSAVGLGLVSTKALPAEEQIISKEDSTTKFAGQLSFILSSSLYKKTNGLINNIAGLSNCIFEDMAIHRFRRCGVYIRFDLKDFIGGESRYIGCSIDAPILYIDDNNIKWSKVVKLLKSPEFTADFIITNPDSEFFIPNLG